MKKIKLTKGHQQMNEDVEKIGLKILSDDLNFLYRVDNEINYYKLKYGKFWAERYAHDIIKISRWESRNRK